MFCATINQKRNMLKHPLKKSTGQKTLMEAIIQYHIRIR